MYHRRALDRNVLISSESRMLNFPSNQIDLNHNQQLQDNALPSKEYIMNLLSFELLVRTKSIFSDGIRKMGNGNEWLQQAQKDCQQWIYSQVVELCKRFQVIFQAYTARCMRDVVYSSKTSLLLQLDLPNYLAKCLLSP